MTLGLYLLRRHARIYLWFWVIFGSSFGVVLSALLYFGVWNPNKPEVSLWLLGGNQAPMWLAFAMGVMLSSTHLPVAIANGVTRREFCAGAAVFVTASAVLFGLLMLVGQLAEMAAYEMTGTMDRLLYEYPSPGVESTVSTILILMTLMISGWLVALAYYRLPVPWAMVLTPLAVLPVLANGAFIPYYDPHWTLQLGITVLSGVVAYLAARRVPIRPRKA